MITGEELKQARKKLGKTQEQVAEEMEISLRRLSRLENNVNLQRYNEFLELVVTLELYKRNEGKNEEEQQEDDIKNS